MKILLVEDEVDLGNTIADCLRQNGYTTEWVTSFNDAHERLMLYEYDCVLVDLMLPDGNGIQLIKSVRAIGKSDGLLVISARDTLESRLEGLHSGADDYLTKPFHLSELLARVQALIRRKNFAGNNSIRFNEIEIDLNLKEVQINGKSIQLTRKEYDLLLFLLSNNKRVLSKNAIAENLSGDMADMLINHDFVYTHIKNLKKKLNLSGAGDYLKTIYGIGYKWSE